MNPLLSGVRRILLAGLTLAVAAIARPPISPTSPCASNYIIYIANNSNGQVGSTENVYEPNVVPTLTALPASSSLKNGDTWLDEWTRYLYQDGAVVPSGSNNGAVVTYVLDAYNSQNDAGYSASLKAAAIPVDYGSGAVTVYHGSNDGTLRAVDASTGKERWALVAPEFYSPAPTVYPPTGNSTSPPTGLERLMWSQMTDASSNQMVTSALIVAGIVTFSTNRAAAPGTGTCSPLLGYACGYWVNITRRARGSPGT